MAAAASTAFPPFWNIMAPAVAASGLPVIAIQCRACSGGLKVRGADTMTAVVRTVMSATALDRTRDTVSMCLPWSCVVQRPSQRPGQERRRTRKPNARLPRKQALRMLYLLRWRRCAQEADGRHPGPDPRDHARP